MSNIADFDLQEYEDMAKRAVEWYDVEKTKLVLAMRRQKKPFSQATHGIAEYQELANANWGQIVAERGLDEARRLARRFFKLRDKYGDHRELPPPQLLDKHVSPHPRDPQVNENLNA